MSTSNEGSGLAPTSPAADELTVSFPGGLRVDAQYRGHTIHTDQSPRAGGDGSAPEPFSLLLAALGTCAGVYVLSFCRARQLPTDGLRVVQRMERGPEGKGIAAIAITIEVPPSFPDKYHAALVRAAETCAVKKLIEHPPRMSVTTTVV